MASWRWQGPVVAIANGEKYFRAVECRRSTASAEGKAPDAAAAVADKDKDKDAEPVVYAVSDCALLQGGAAQIVHVMAMWEAGDGGKRAEVRYFCNARAVDRSLRGSSGASKRGASSAASKALNELYESDRIEEVDIAAAFERKVSVGVKTKAAKEEFVAAGMYHVKTRRVVPLKANVSRMQRSRTMGFRVQMVPASQDEEELQSSDRKRRRVNSDDGASTASNGRNRSGSVANAVLSIDPGVLAKLQRACEELQLSSLPRVMTGRDRERSEIYKALRNSINAQSAGGPIYISGLPGVGKTSIVKEIIKSLEAQRTAGELPRFVWIEVNGLHMPKPDVAYSVIWKALQEGEDMPRLMSPARVCGELQREFQADDPDRPILLILIDEMDFMLAGKNEVLYNLLEWQSFATSKLVLVGIANTMDLPERLAPKIRSRFGLHRITFPPYTKDQLEQIIEQRLGQLDVFSKEAIQVCSKSLAHKSGDVRQALTVCRKAVEVCIRRLSHDNDDTGNDTVSGGGGGGGNSSSSSDLYVTGQDLQHAQQAVSVSAPMSRLRACSKFECIFVIALQMEVKTKERQEGEFEDVVNRFAILCKTYSFSPIPRLRGFIWICDELERSGLIRQIRSKSSRYPRLELRCSNQEIHEVFLTHAIGRQLIS